MQEIRTVVLQAICSNFLEMGRMSILISKAKIEVT